MFVGSVRNVTTLHLLRADQDEQVNHATLSLGLLPFFPATMFVGSVSNMTT